YSRLLLHFVYVVTTGLRDVETFVFGTRLTRITRLLQNRDIDEAVDAVSGQVRDWGGGTRIGDALKQFNFEWGRRVLGHGAVALLISDGWDRGDPELVRQELARLQRTTYRLIWLNPLLGRPGYQPLTRALQAGLPYVDDFLSVNNLRSLEQLGTALAGIAAPASRIPAR
ncbi:MAG TPA: VWA domain-containing protein, partial [Herpetosiphonaceae bacterium]|nr:VWA domain-containing protein [Herpetosiphonaceae bacterium]